MGLHYIYDEHSKHLDPTINASTVFNIIEEGIKSERIKFCTYPENLNCDKSSIIKISAINLQEQHKERSEFTSLELHNGSTVICKQIDNSLYCINEPNTDESLYEQLKLIFYFISGLIVITFSFFVFSDVHRLYKLSSQPFEKIRLPDFRLSKKSFLYPLSSSLQAMKNKIEELSRFQVEFIETICHDIKTPLSKIKFQLEMPEIKDTQSAERIKRYMIEMENYLDDFLQLSANDYTQRRLRLAKVNLQQQLQHQLHEFQELTSHQLVLLCPETLELQADPILLQRALNNLVSNALRFCNSKVHVSVYQLAEYCWIVVDDDGVGFANKQPENYHSLVQTHHGMGLEIVRKISTAHGGELKIEQSPLGGCRVKFSIRCNHT